MGKNEFYLGRFPFFHNTRDLWIFIYVLFQSSTVNLCFDAQCVSSLTVGAPSSWFLRYFYIIPICVCVCAFRDHCVHALPQPWFQLVGTECMERDLLFPLIGVAIFGFWKHL